MEFSTSVDSFFVKLKCGCPIERYYLNLPLRGVGKDCIKIFHIRSESIKIFHRTETSTKKQA